MQLVFVWWLGLAAPATFALSAQMHGSRVRPLVRSPNSIQCYAQWPNDSQPEPPAEEQQIKPPQAEPPRAELPGAKYLTRMLSNPKVDVALGAPVIVSASVFAVQTLGLGGYIGSVYFSPMQVYHFLQDIEIAISIVFAVEYFLRWYASSLAPSYLVKPAAIIDLISFLPLIITLLMGSASAPVGDLAFLRLLRVLRLQRYLQDTESFKNFQLAVGIEQTEVRPYQLELARVGSSLLTLIFIATGSIYEAEHQVNENIPDFFTALYFGLTTLTTVVTDRHSNLGTHLRSAEPVFAPRSVSPCSHRALSGLWRHLPDDIGGQAGRVRLHHRRSGGGACAAAQPS